MASLWKKIAAGIRPDLIVRSSAGALVGAAYAAQCDIAGTLDRVREVFAIFKTREKD